MEVGFSGWYPNNIKTIKKEGSLLVSAWEFIFDNYNPPLIDQNNIYNFIQTDQVVRLAKQNGLRLRAQDLLYGVPDFVERGNYRKEDLLEFIENYVRTMVGRYKGEVSQWSVANEIMQPWRDASFLYRAFNGNLDWLKLAFRVARETDPNAMLILNDTGIEFSISNPRYLPGYTNRFYQVVKELKDSGTPIDAVGFQMHLFAEDYQNPQNLQKWISSFKSNIRRYKNLGVDVVITEFDIRLGNLSSLTQQERYRVQAQIYYEFVRAAREMGVTNISFFAVRDVDSWLENPNFGGPNAKKNDPCLFDKESHRKPAYYFVLKALTIL